MFRTNDGPNRHLDFVLSGHTFTISAVVLRLDAPGTYPMLLGRPWLHMTNIKQHWQRNMISFRHEKTKVPVATEEGIPTPKDTTPYMLKLSTCSTVWPMKKSQLLGG